MTEDILFFFDREPQALSLFELLCEQAMARWPSSGLMVSFGLSAPLQSPRLFAVANPAPGRYTHHVQVRDFSELDDELMQWIAWSHENMAARQRR